MKSYRSFPGLFFILFLIFGVSSYSLALEVPVFSPLRYTIDGAQGTAVYTETVRMGNVVSGEFHLIVQNGSGGANKVDLAEVSIDGKRLVKLTQSKDFKDKKFKLLKDSELRISLTGPRGSFVVVSIIARKVTQVPLVIRMPQGDAQAAMTASLLKVKKKPTFASHGFVPTGSVIAQTPQAGVYVKEKTKASITVSTGPALAYNLLPGIPDTPASSSVVDYSSHDTIPSTEIEELGPNMRIARTKLEIGFTPTATVGQINALLTSIGGQITAMLKGVNQIIIRIPDPENMAALDTLIAQIQSNPIVRYVLKGYMGVTNTLPPNVDVVTYSTLTDRIDHHLDVRAHAAWNAKGLLINKFQHPHLIVDDYFGDGKPNSDFGVASASWDFATGKLNSHGYRVLGVIAATFGGNALERGMATGMYPASGYLPHLWAVDEQWGYDQESSDTEIINRVALLGTNVVVNTSLGVICAGNPLDKSCMEPYALSWIEKVRGSTLYPTGQTGPQSLENSFIHLTSAGNIDPAAPADTDARLNSGWNAARLLTTLAITETATPVANLTNTLVIENRDKSPVILGGTPGCIDADSKFPGDLSAIGTNVFSLAGADDGVAYSSGTSFATPQVAGLAAYLWAIKPGLTPQQIIDILVRTADSADCGGTNGQPVIDAYAAVLALDRNYPDMEVRRAILDLNEDRFFNETDVEKFLTEFDIANGAKDYSRYDLNGDGLTGGDSKAKFNLDMDYSPTYTTVTQTIEGNSVSFNENSLTDLEILCYYAYSRLYTGDTDKRKDLLKEKCGKEPSVDVRSVRALTVVSDGQNHLCQQDLTQGDGYSPLPLPIIFAPSCSPYSQLTTTFEEIGPGHVSVSFSGSAKREACVPVPPNLECGWTVGSSNSVAAVGRILTAGPYTVEISAVPSPSPPAYQKLDLSITIRFAEVTALYLRCLWSVSFDYDVECCSFSDTQPWTCSAFGPRVFDIDVPNEGMNNRWDVDFSFGAGAYPWADPADFSATGVFSIRPKQ